MRIPHKIINIILPALLIGCTHHKTDEEISSIAADEISDKVPAIIESNCVSRGSMEDYIQEKLWDVKYDIDQIKSDISELKSQISIFKTKISEMNDIEDTLEEITNKLGL